MIKNIAKVTTILSCSNRFIIKTFLILYYIKQIDSKLPCVCSVIDHRGRQNVVRTSVTHSAAPRVPLFCSYHILTSSVIYYWTVTHSAAPHVPLFCSYHILTLSVIYYRTVTHSAAPHMPLFCSYHILTSSVIYYWTDARQLGIYLLNINFDGFWTLMVWHFWQL